MAIKKDAKRERETDRESETKKERKRVGVTKTEKARESNR